MSHPVLTLEHVGMCYRRQRGIFGDPFWALRDVSFTLYSGETLGIIGRNGVGKSTLLRLLAGIFRPDRGRLINHGVRVSLLSLQVGFVPHLTGRENAILSAMLMGLRRREIEARMDEIIDFAELDDFIDQPTAIYSAGMNARLGFAVAMQIDPDVLLVDEVLGVGDEDFRQKSSAAMRARMQSGQTVVFVSHNLGMVRNLSDRVIWIEDGIVLEEGSSEKVLSDYQAHLKISK